MSDFAATPVSELIRDCVLQIEDGNHGEYRPRREEFTDDGTAFIRAADMSSVGIDFQGAEKINDIARRRIRKGIGAPQDTILSHKGTVGKVAFATANSPNFVCSPQTTFWRSLDHERIDPRFLFYTLQSRFFQDQLSAFCNESDMAPYVSLTTQKKLHLPLVAIGQQRGIASILGALDDKIAVNDRIRSACHELGDALIRAENDRTERTVSLDELARAGELIFGDGYRTKRTEHGQPGLPILRVAEVQNGYISPKMGDLVKEVHRPAMGTKTSKSGDVVLTTKGTVGRVAIIPDGAPEFVYSPQLCYFRVTPNSPVSASHLFYWFRSEDFLSQARSLKSQTDMADYLNLSDIKSLKIKVPPARDASEFLARISDVELMASKRQSESRALATLRDMLLPKLMSGEIRVRDAEKVVEDAA